tara:strand:+ start:521 stop:889 length:369 start_codon:yes stop_codon:yes gene_type:complete
MPASRALRKPLKGLFPEWTRVAVNGISEYCVSTNGEVRRALTPAAIKRSSLCSLRLQQSLGQPLVASNTGFVSLSNDGKSITQRYKKYEEINVCCFEIHFYCFIAVFVSFLLTVFQFSSFLF